MGSTVRAAGGLLWRARDGVVEVALAHRPKHQDWSLPKGKLHLGEHPLAGACREVAEETGAGFVVGMRLPSTTYQVLTSGGAAEKTVDYWAMRAAGDVLFRPNDEVDELRWVDLDEAADALTYPRDREVVEAFVAAPRALATVLLVQPAEAESREDWDGPDVTRPLTAVGEAYAARLAALLACFAPARVVSATPRRCVRTVTPLAHASGVEVASDSVFDWESHGRSPEVASARIRAFAKAVEADAAEVGVAPDSVAVCCEEDVIPDTVALLADTDGLAVPTVATATGAAWALSFADSTLIAADYLPPIA